MKKVQQAAHKRENQKKRKLLVFHNLEQIIGFLFFIIIISTSVWTINCVKNWLEDPDQMVLSQLTFSGDHAFTTEGDLRQAILGLGLPNTYVGQNVDDIQQEIMRYPWIKQASVRKQWPDRLIVYIEEYKPTFYWNDLYLLDDAGNVFSVPFDRLGELQLPRIYGPEGKAKSMLEMYAKLDAISKKLANNKFASEIKVAIADDRNAWQLMIKQCTADLCSESQDIKLIIGTENIEQHYYQFIKLFPEILSRMPADEKITAADLRYENGISVQREKISQ